jgi:hypothetical protein
MAVVRAPATISQVAVIAGEPVPVCRRLAEGEHPGPAPGEGIESNNCNNRCSFYSAIQLLIPLAPSYSGSTTPVRTNNPDTTNTSGTFFISAAQF